MLTSRPHLREGFHIETLKKSFCGAQIISFKTNSCWGVGWEFVLCKASKEVACCASLMDDKAMPKPALLASHMFHFRPLIAPTQALPTCV